MVNQTNPTEKNEGKGNSLYIKYYILILMICHAIVDHALSFLSQVVRTSSVRGQSYDAYIMHFPAGLRPFIHYITDVAADENCGFKAIARLLGMREDSWAQVRVDLIQELDSYRCYYEPIFGGVKAVHKLRYSIAYLREGPSYEYWMTFPECGHLITSYYNIVVYLLSARQCRTFLPLRSDPSPATTRKEVFIGFVNENHFVHVNVNE